MGNGYPREIQFYPWEIGIHPRSRLSYTRNEPPNPRKNQLYPRRRKLKSYVVLDLAKNFILKSSVGDGETPTDGSFTLLSGFFVDCDNFYPVFKVFLETSQPSFLSTIKKVAQTMVLACTTY